MSIKQLVIGYSLLGLVAFGFALMFSQLNKEVDLKSNVRSLCISGDVSCSYLYKKDADDYVTYAGGLYGVVGKDTILLTNAVPTVDVAIVKVREYHLMGDFVKFEWK